MNVRDLDDLETSKRFFDKQLENKNSLNLIISLQESEPLTRQNFCGGNNNGW